MPYITAGDPPEVTLQALISRLDGAGADIIEIGVPFSDPIADGPVIASAMYRSLQEGMTPARVLEGIASARSESDVGLVAMVSDSIVTHRGRERFVAEAADAGLDGLIVPDADTGDLDELAQACEAHDLGLIPLIAPTSSLERQQALLARASGFVYLLARAGVTGVRTDAPDIAERVQALRELTRLPIAVGFGISTAAHVASVGESADGAIIGSALVNELNKAHQSGGDVLETAERFVSALSA